MTAFAAIIDRLTPRWLEQLRDAERQCAEAKRRAAESERSADAVQRVNEVIRDDRRRNHYAEAMMRALSPGKES